MSKTLLKEGTWSGPQTAQQAQQLQKLMATPIPAGKATDVLYHLMGDDKLFDSIGETSDKDGPDADVRPLVKGKLREWLKDLSTWKKPWEPNAIKIAKQIIQENMKQKPNKFKTLLENTLVRFQRSQFLTGDLVTFKKGWEKDPWIQANTGYADKIKEFITSKDNLRVSCTKSNSPAVFGSFGNYENQSANIATITRETAPGLYIDFIDVPTSVIEVKDTGINLAKVPEDKRKKDPTQIEPKEVETKSKSDKEGDIDYSPERQTGTGDKSKDRKLLNKNVPIKFGNKKKWSGKNAGSRKNDWVKLKESAHVSDQDLISEAYKSIYNEYTENTNQPIKLNSGEFEWSDAHDLFFILTNRVKVGDRVEFFDDVTNENIDGVVVQDEAGKLYLDNTEDLNQYPTFDLDEEVVFITTAEGEIFQSEDEANSGKGTTETFEAGTEATVVDDTGSDYVQVQFGDGTVALVSRLVLKPKPSSNNPTKSINIPDDKIINLEDLMESVSVAAQCPKCKKTRTVSSKQDLIKSPDCPRCGHVLSYDEATTAWNTGDADVELTIDRKPEFGKKSIRESIQAPSDIEDPKEAYIRVSSQIYNGGMEQLIGNEGGGERGVAAVRGLIILAGAFAHSNPQWKQAKALLLGQLKTYEHHISGIDERDQWGNHNPDLADAEEAASEEMDKTYLQLTRLLEQIDKELNVYDDVSAQGDVFGIDRNQNGIKQQIQNLPPLQESNKSLYQSEENLIFEAYKNVYNEAKRYKNPNDPHPMDDMGGGPYGERIGPEHSGLSDEEVELKIGDKVSVPEYDIMDAEIVSIHDGMTNPQSGGQGPIYEIKDIKTGKVIKIWPEFIEKQQIQNLPPTIPESNKNLHKNDETLIFESYKSMYKESLEQKVKVGDRVVFDNVEGNYSDWGFQSDAEMAPVFEHEGQTATVTKIAVDDTTPDQNEIDGPYYVSIKFDDGFTLEGVDNCQLTLAHPHNNPELTSQQVSGRTYAGSHVIGSLDDNAGMTKQ